MRKSTNDISDNYERNQKSNNKYLARHPDTWQPCVFMDAYIYKNSYESGCDYKDVLYKIPPIHKMIDTRTNKEVLGLFIPAGDVQIELWKNLGNDNKSDNLHLVIQEVDNYSNGYVKHMVEKTDLDKLKFTGYGFQKSRDGSGEYNVRTKAADNTGEYGHKVFEQTVVERILSLFKPAGDEQSSPMVNTVESTASPGSPQEDNINDDIPF
jgi:hypothetical protein